MKKTLFTIVGIIMMAGAYAQTDSTTHKMNRTGTDKTKDSMNPKHHDMHKSSKALEGSDKNHQDGVMMKDGKMWMVKGSKTTVLDHTMTMDNGTKVMGDGTYTKKDGTKMTLKEGEHMDMTGKINPKKE